MVSDTKRLFLAIPIDQSFRQLCQDFIEAQNLSEIRWIKSENWHVTLLFLGDFPADSLQNLENLLQQHFLTQNGFVIDFESFTYIPNQYRPRMIWGKFYDNEDFDKLLKRVFRSLKAFYKKGRIPFEIKTHRDSIPHITLCRLKKYFSSENNLTDVINQDISLKLKVNSCQLYKSELKPTGAEYTMLKEFELI